MVRGIEVGYCRDIINVVLARATRFKNYFECFVKGHPGLIKRLAYPSPFYCYPEMDRCTSSDHEEGFECSYLNYF